MLQEPPTVATGPSGVPAYSSTVQGYVHIVHVAQRLTAYSVATFTTSVQQQVSSNCDTATLAANTGVCMNGVMTDIACVAAVCQCFGKQHSESQQQLSTCVNYCNCCWYQCFCDTDNQCHIFGRAEQQLSDVPFCADQQQPSSYFWSCLCRCVCRYRKHIHFVCAIYSRCNW